MNFVIVTVLFGLIETPAALSVQIIENTDWSVSIKKACAPEKPRERARAREKRRRRVKP